MSWRKLIPGFPRGGLGIPVPFPKGIVFRIPGGIWTHPPGSGMILWSSVFSLLCLSSFHFPDSTFQIFFPGNKELSQVKNLDTWEYLRSRESIKLPLVPLGFVQRETSQGWFGAGHTTISTAGAGICGNFPREFSVGIFRRNFP